MKRVLSLLLVVLLAFSALTGCAASGETQQDSGKYTIIAAVYPVYDWLKNITDGAENVEVELLVDGGADLHSYQPTADDMVRISHSDMFVYVGGVSDAWVGDAMNSIVSRDKTDVVDLLTLLGDKVKEEEEVEGMQPEEEEEEEGAKDEHVWLSLRNAEALCKGLSKSLEQHNEANAALYRKNTDAYLKKLDALDKRYSEALYDRKYDTLLFADRFPFRYLTDDYDIRYYAAFAGCSAESEASFETVAFLSQKLNELKLPAVITIDGSDQKIAKTVLSTADSDAEILTLDSMQSAKTDGDSYLSVMESNLEVLKKALL
ncbi:MAG: metal ABC transporter substrate-binding protein [Ruminococcus sp.]